MGLECATLSLDKVVVVGQRRHRHCLFPEIFADSGDLSREVESDEVGVDSLLRLSPETLVRTGEHDDQFVPAVHGLVHQCHVRAGLARLHIAKYKTFALDWWMISAGVCKQAEDSFCGPA